MVVGFGIVLVDKVAVVGAYKLHAIFLGKLDKLLVGTLLQGEGLAVGTLARVFHLVALKLQIVVVAKHTLVPLQCLARSLDVALEDLGRHLACDTCRAYNKVLVIFLKVLAVGTWSHVVAVDPGAGYELDEILVAVVVLRKHNEVVAAHVAFLLNAVALAAVGNIHLAAEDGLEGFLALSLQLPVDFVAVVVQLLHTEHVAVVGDGHSLHAVGYSLVDNLLHGRLSVEDGIICMYV